VVLREDEHAKVPVVQLKGVRDGNLHGQMLGEVRFFLGSSQVLPHGDGTFLVPADVLLTHEITVLVPEGMSFVASKRGKRYYPVLSSQAQRLVPENRIYFENEDEAQRAGYLPWKP